MAEDTQAQVDEVKACRDRLFGLKKKARVEPVTIKDADGSEETYHVRTISAREQGALESSLRLKDRRGNVVGVDQDQVRGRVVAACVCTPSGVPLCGQSDVGLLGDLPNVALHAIYEAAMKLNGLSGSSVEEEEKN